MGYDRNGAVRHVREYAEEHRCSVDEAVEALVDRLDMTDGARRIFLRAGILAEVRSESTKSPRRIQQPGHRHGAKGRKEALEFVDSLSRRQRGPARPEPLVPLPDAEEPFITTVIRIKDEPVEKPFTKVFRIRDDAG